MTAFQDNPIRILLVDDELDSLRITTKLLEDAGYAVTTAESGQEGLSAIQEQKPDVVLLDVVMPGMDGFEVCRQIKSDPVLKDCYVMMFSGKRLDAEDQARGLDAGADGYLTRPFVRREFLSRLRSLIRIQQTQKEIRNKEHWFRNAVANVNDGVFATDAGGRIVFMNPAAEEITGWSITEAVGMPATEIYRIRNDQSGERKPDPVERVLKEGIVIGLSNHTLLFRKDGATRFIADSAAPIRDSADEITGVVVAFQDVTEFREKEIAAYRAFKERDDIFQAIGHPTLLLNAERRIINANRAQLELIGKPLEEILNLRCYEVCHNGSGAPERCPMTAMLRSGRLEKQDMEMEALGRHYLVSCTPVTDEAGELRHVIHIATDITRRKEAEWRIEASLREKETLLQEIHHRVKNNMQVISSLLQLQTTRENNPQVQEILRESQNRVHTLSSVHELLCSSDNLSEIDLAEFATTLVTSLFQSYRVDSSRIGMTIQCDDIPVTMKVANPLGLLVNELVSNAIKYAFPGKRKGTISLEIRKRGAEVEVLVQDDGIGIPPDVDLDHSDTLGLQFVRTLVRKQLEGSVELERMNGSRYRIRFDPMRA